MLTIDLPVQLKLDRLDSPVTFDRAREADVAAIAGLLAGDAVSRTRGESGDDLEPYLSAFAEVEADSAQLLLVGRDADGEVIATLQLSRIPGLSRRGMARLQVEAVHVAESHQGSGLGTAIFEWIIEQAAHCGTGLVQLTSDVRRTEARRFYERLGFTASHLGFKYQV